MAQSNVAPDIWHSEFHINETKRLPTVETSHPAVPKHMVVDAYVLHLYACVALCQLWGHCSMIVQYENLELSSVEGDDIYPSKKKDTERQSSWALCCTLL